MSESLQVPFDLDIEDSTVITPRFLNWERSFVSGPNSPLFEVEHRISNTNPEVLITRVKFKPSAEGPPGHVHGGATAGLIDEVMGVLVWHSHNRCVTEKLSLQYLRPVPLKNESILLTRIYTPNSTEAKRIEIRTTIYDQQKSPYVLAQGLFHRLSEAQLENFRKHHKPDF